jgi:hypothetical protein
MAKAPLSLCGMKATSPHDRTEEAGPYATVAEPLVHHASLPAELQRHPFVF